jgi:GMP synthase-like glutamine amidotransferase
VQRSKGVSSVQFPFWQRYNPRVNKITIFRHAAHEGPGYFADFLDRKGIGHRLIRVDCDDPIPESLDGISGLVFMGGPMSVNDPLPWIPKLTRLIQQAIAADVPVLGHCLGGQLMAKALCASITRNPVKEIGWFPVTVVESGESREWFRDLPSTFVAYHWHGETFAIPKGATRVLASADCANQGFAVGKHLALQCHVEMTPQLIASWVDETDGELKPSRTVQSGAEMLRDAPRRTQEMHRIADVLYERWIQGLR